MLGIKQNERYDASKIAERHRDHALYVGFAPAENPQIAIAIIVENGGGGGSTAAPMARKIFDAYLLNDAPETINQDKKIPPLADLFENKENKALAPEMIFPEPENT